MQLLHTLLVGCDLGAQVGDGLLGIARRPWAGGKPLAQFFGGVMPEIWAVFVTQSSGAALETTGDETMPQLVGKWARATKAGATPLQGPAYYACWDCGHKGPAVDCTGRTSEDCRADRALNAEMKRLWNAQTPNVGAKRAP